MWGRLVQKSTLSVPGKRLLSVLSHDATCIVVDGLGDGPVRFRTLFLRDASQSSDAIDSETQQKRFSTGQLTRNVYPANLKVHRDSLQIKWSDGHESSYTKSWLSRYSSLGSSLAYRRQIDEWAPWKQLIVHQMDYNQLELKSSAAFRDGINTLNRSGIIQITGVPPGEGEPPTVELIASHIGGYPKDTFYGRSWNVKSVQAPRNVAYTSVYLPLHMDLLYYESPPGIQLLHCIENSATGGESIYSDAYSAILHVLERDPEAYDALCEVPLTYHYVNDGHHYFQMRPLIVQNRFSPISPVTGRHAVENINYSPPFQGPIDIAAIESTIPTAKFDSFLRGIRAFEAFIEAPENQIEFKLEEGTCVVFFNRRILHARREFDASSGDRFFKGAYTDIDSFKSTVRTLQ